MEKIMQMSVVLLLMLVRQSVSDDGSPTFRPDRLTGGPEQALEYRRHRTQAALVQQDQRVGSRDPVLHRGGALVGEAAAGLVVGNDGDQAGGVLEAQLLRQRKSPQQMHDLVADGIAAPEGGIGLAPGPTSLMPL